MRLIRLKVPKTKIKLGQRRRRVKPIWQRRAFVMVIVTMFLVMVGGSLWQIWVKGSIDNFLEKVENRAVLESVKLGFSVQSIFVEGRNYTDRKNLLNALGLERGQAIFDFDPSISLAKILNLPWIQSAIVERQLPDIVYVSLVERRPLAVWQNGGGFNLIDIEGEIIPTHNVGKFGGLINIVGDFAPQNSKKLFSVLSLVPELAKRVEAAVFVKGRRWNVQFKNKVQVLLPETGEQVAWVKLAELNSRHFLLEKNVEVIDLRLEDRVFVRPKFLVGKEKERMRVNIQKSFKAPKSDI